MSSYIPGAVEVLLLEQAEVETGHGLHILALAQLGESELLLLASEGLLQVLIHFVDVLPQDLTLVLVVVARRHQGANRTPAALLQGALQRLDLLLPLFHYQLLRVDLLGLHLQNRGGVMH